MTEVMEVEEVKKKGRPKKETPPVEVVCDEREYLQEKSFKFEWLDLLASQYGFDKFEYLHKFRAFRCYRENKHLDWIDVNDLSLLNGGRRLDEIRLKHQAVSPKRDVIQ